MKKFLAIICLSFLLLPACFAAGVGRGRIVRPEPDNQQLMQYACWKYSGNKLAINQTTDYVRIHHWEFPVEVYKAAVRTEARHTWFSILEGEFWCDPPYWVVDLVPRSRLVEWNNDLDIILFTYELLKKQGKLEGTP